MSLHSPDRLGTLWETIKSAVMRNRAINFLLVVAVAMGWSGCNDDLIHDPVPGFPLFGIDVEAVDFGRVAVGDVVEQTFTVRNNGARGSELHLYYYVEGSEVYTVVGADEATLTPYDEPQVVRIAFQPVGPGEAEANLVIYHSNVPLKEDVNVSTYRVALSGAGTGTCHYPKDAAVCQEHGIHQAARLESDHRQ